MLALPPPARAAMQVKTCWRAQKNVVSRAFSVWHWGLAGSSLVEDSAKRLICFPDVVRWHDKTVPSYATDRRGIARRRRPAGRADRLGGRAGCPERRGLAAIPSRDGPAVVATFPG